MNSFTNMIKWLTSVTGSYLFLRSNTFQMATLKIEEIYLLTEAEISRQLSFLKRVLVVPTILIAVACLGGHVVGVMWDQSWAISIARAMTVTAALICGLGVFAVSVQATVFAHLIIAAARLGYGFARAITGLAGKVLGTDLKVEDASLTQETADKLATWLKNITAWVAVVCAIAMVTPIWADPGKTAFATILILALAMFMSKIASVWPQRVAVWSLLAAVSLTLVSLWFPVQTTLTSQWFAGTVGADEQAERVLVQDKIDELHDEKLAIKARALEVEKPFASIEDEARYATIEILIKGYTAELHGSAAPAAPPAAKPAPTPAPAPVAAAPAPVVVEPAPTETLGLEPLPAAEGVAALGPDQVGPVSVVTDAGTPEVLVPSAPAQTGTTVASKSRPELNRAKALLQRYGH